jgi:hypothetical protein
MTFTVGVSEPVKTDVAIRGISRVNELVVQVVLECAGAGA